MTTTKPMLIIRPTGRPRIIAGSLLLVLSVFGATDQLGAQETVGVPFIGRNHLSFYTTSLNRSGTGDGTAAVYGAMYGHRFGDRREGVEVTVSGRAAARVFREADDGIIDTGLTVAATRAIPQLGQLNVSAAAGIGAMGWGHGVFEEETPENGRTSVRFPLSAAAAYDVMVGQATFAPFAALTPTYTTERDYVDEVRVARDSGWRVGGSVGMSFRYDRLVMSLSSLHGERGLTKSHRLVFSGGVSW